MTRGVRLYLVGSFVLVSLAGCGRGFFQSAERAPWRAEAEVACLKSGAVKETADVVRISPISGPGGCGAEYPLKVAALGDDIGGLGFAGLLAGGERNDEGRTAARRWVMGYVTAVVGNDAPGLCQAKAEPAASFSPGKKGIKQMGPGGRGDAGAVVDD